MASTINPFDFAGEDLATFLAKVKGDGTYADLIQAAKKDQAGLETDATQIDEAAGAIYGDTLDDFILAAYPLLRAWANYTPPVVDPWTEIAEIDLRTPGTVAIVGDGPVSINGWDWVVSNFAGASSMGHGPNGFEIACLTGNKTYDGDSFDNAPRILLDLASQVPDFFADVSRPIEVWADWDSWSLPTSLNLAVAGISSPSGTFGNTCMGSGVRNATGTIYPAVQAGGNIQVANRVIPAFDVTKFRMLADTMLFGFSAEHPGVDLWPSGFPEAIARVVWSSSSSNSLLYRLPASASQTAFFAVSTNTTNVGAPSATLRRLRILLGP